MVGSSAKTPRYVLRDGAHPISPVVVQASVEGEVTAIFGFSGKPAYDVFLKAQSETLTPFPLVRLYLQNQIDLDGDSLRLVVLDATSPQQELLQAATSQAVLESFRTSADSVLISHQLIREGDSPGYRVEALQDHALGLSR